MGFSAPFIQRPIATVLLALGLLLGMQRLCGSHRARCLAVQIQARRILGHAGPVAAASAPGREALLELLAGNAEQLQVLLGILQDAFFQRHLGRWVDRERQGEVLLQTPDRLDCRVLLAGLVLSRWRRFARLLAVCLRRLLFGPQAVTQFS